MPNDNEGQVYWQSPVLEQDDFGQPITDSFYDAKTVYGPWATMSPLSFETHGDGRLGTGRGQRYQRQPDGRYLKVEG